MDQPSFQPVTLNVFPALPMVTVISHMPGSVATTHHKHTVNATISQTMTRVFSDLADLHKISLAVPRGCTARW